MVNFQVSINKCLIASTNVDMSKLTDQLTVVFTDGHEGTISRTLITPILGLRSTFNSESPFEHSFYSLGLGLICVWGNRPMMEHCLPCFHPIHQDYGYNLPRFPCSDLDRIPLALDCPQGPETRNKMFVICVIFHDPFALIFNKRPSNPIE